jgi:filamentous hemagglutinin family protein
MPAMIQQSHHRAALRYTILIGFTLLLAFTVSQAEIVTDGSVGPVVTVAGSSMTIEATLGQQRGANLFHSFHDFNIQNGETATFTGPNTIHNVISRVTGGQLSRIDGTIRSEIGTADIFLINPAGVLMGPQATIDVPAAFHLSTADTLHFTDGTTWPTTQPTTSTLTSAPPAAFGFLTPQAGTIELIGSQLTVQSGHDITLSAHDINLTGRTTRPAELRAPGGHIHLHAQGANTGSLPITATATPTSLQATGQITLDNADLITTSVSGQGGITLHAGSAALTNSQLSNYNQGHNDAERGIDLWIQQQLALQASTIRADGRGAGAAAPITVRAGDLSLQDGSRIGSDASQIFADTTPRQAGQVSLTVERLLAITAGSTITTVTNGDGAAGNISIQAHDLTIDGSATAAPYTGLFSEASYGAGDSGQINVQADHITLAHGGAISTSTAGAGHAGTIGIHADNILTLHDGATIHSDTSATGAAGRVSVNGSAVSLSGAGTAISSQALPGATGAGGVVDLLTSQLTVSDNATISTATAGPGAAGTVTINTHALSLIGGQIETDTSASGAAGRIKIHAQTASLAVGGTISSRSRGQGAAGSIDLLIDRALQMQPETAIYTDTISTGAGGHLHITAATAQLERAELSSATRGQGDAGTINLVIDQALALMEQTRIHTDTSGNGAGGHISVDAATITMNESQLNSATTGSGNAGAITLQAPIIQLTASTLSSHSQGAGNAGTITVTAPNTIQLTQSLLTTATQGTGAAGHLHVQGSDILLHESVIKSDSHHSGAAGEITVTAANTLQLDQATLTTATQGAGTAGQIALQGSNLTVHDSMISSASSGLGAAGAILVHFDDAVTIAEGSQLYTSSQDRGAAGMIQMRAGTLTIADSGLNSATAGLAPGGAIEVVATNQIELMTNAHLTTDTAGDAPAGHIHMTAPTMATHSALISSQTQGAGAAGQIDLVVTHALDLFANTVLNTDTQTSGQAGAIVVQAGQLRLDASTIRSTTHGDGQAGQLQILVADQAQLFNQAALTTSTTGGGAGGVIHLQAHTLTLDHSAITSTASASGAAGTIDVVIAQAFQMQQAQISTTTTGSGDAGTITLQAPTMLVGDTAIQSSTQGAGAAGTLAIHADQLSLTGANAQLATVATADASGASGHILIGGITTANAQQVHLAPGAQILLTTDQQQPAATTVSQLQIQTANLLLNAARISTQSSGPVPAGAIRIDALDQVTLAAASRITTFAQQADAGAITLDTATLRLNRSLIETSAGTAGDGGDIRLQAHRLLTLNGGMVQANTLAPQAQGGYIELTTPLLLAQYGLLELGGKEPRVFNAQSYRSVIQAAAPAGIAGTIHLSDPIFDLAALSAAPRVPLVDTAALLRDLCEQVQGDRPSHLIDRSATPGSTLIEPTTDRRQLPIWTKHRLQQLML